MSIALSKYIHRGNKNRTNWRNNHGIKQYKHLHDIKCEVSYCNITVNYIKYCIFSFFLQEHQKGSAIS